MSNTSIDDSSQEIFFSDASRSVTPRPVTPRPVTPPPVPARAEVPQPPVPQTPPPLLPQSRPPAPPALSQTRASSMPPVQLPSIASAQVSDQVSASVANREEPESLLARRARLAKLRKQQRWQWLSKLQIYQRLESLWIKFRSVGQQDGDSEEQRKRELPAWLVSFVVHVTLLLILALIPLAHMATSQMQLIVGDFNGEGAIEFTLSPQGSDVSLQEVDLPMTNFTTSLPEIELSTSLANTLGPASPTAEVGDSLAGLAIEQGLAGRSGSLKGSLLKKFGGNADTEAAVKLGLNWLAYHQLADGGWSLNKNIANGTVNDDRTAATAMALNAFLGAGSSHKSGEYKELVARGLKFLLRRQDKEGFFANGEPSHNQSYSQAIATITVCEAYGMTGDSELKIPATRAMKYAQWSQGRQKGWRYTPRDESDLSVTGWYMMALMTGKMAGLEPDQKVIDSVSEYLETVSHDYGARYAYVRNEPPSLSMTAEGLLCRQYLGWPRSHPALQRAIEIDLLPNAPNAEDEIFSVYYWYYATQVLHHVGGQPWNQWNEKMRVALPALQVKAGKEAGSWDPKKDQFGASGGRLYTTCFCIYCLEVYYRHLSLYDVDKDKDLGKDK